MNKANNTNLIRQVSSLRLERGFTIVELLIVIIVIGILATLVLIAYNNVQGQARDTKRQSNAQSVANAAETYKTSSISGYYPDMTSHTTFHSAIDTAANYTNGAATIAVDNSVTLTGTTSLLSIGTVATSTNSGYNLAAQFCGTGTPTYQTATGIKVFYWSESAKVGTKFVQSGVGC